MIGLISLTKPLVAEHLRVATYNTELSRQGPGVLLRDILKGDEKAKAVAKVVAVAAPDIVLLGGVDFDHDLLALRALRDEISKAGYRYPHVFALRPNSGWASGEDLDGDGRTGGPGDAQGYGQFAGQGGIALLSRFPILTDEVQDFSHMLWKDLPAAILPYVEGKVFPSDNAIEVQRLSSVGHWIVPVMVLGLGRVNLLVWHAGPPVFDGPEDRNGRRNHDEARLWTLVLNGVIGVSPLDKFVLLGDANLDVHDGQGRPDAIMSLLSDSRLIDVRPRSEGARIAADARHEGNPAFDTVDWPGGRAGEDGPGNLRVDYVLPSSDWNVMGAGVLWPAPDASGLDKVVSMASRHRLVWVDLSLR